MDIFSFIKQHISIVSVVSEYVTLKKAGGYLKGQCPFHNERTGSFTLSPHKEIFYCFGCHQGGDVISFIAAIERLSPLEAAKHLSERYNLTLPAKLSNDSLHHEASSKRYEQTCTIFAQWCSQQLDTSNEAQQYLTQRGITKHSIHLFNLGYFPAGAIRTLLNYAQHHGTLKEDLISAHILMEGKHEVYSPFEDRIMFPIYDHLGRCRGFGGRIFKTQDTRAKYYNSHDHAFFEKGTILFGLDKAKKRIQQESIAFLVEGYLDCIAMHQAGYSHTIATLGTACTPEHLTQLARYAQQLYLVYDGDPAGKKAVERLAHLCWQVNLELFVISLPAQDDPASFIVKGNSLKPLIDAAEDIFLFLIKHYGTDFHAKRLADKLGLVKELLSMLSTINNPLKQNMLLQKIAATFDIPLEALKEELRGSTSRKPDSEQSLETAIPLANISILEKKSFYAILNYRTILETEDEELLISMLPVPIADLAKKACAFNRSTYTFAHFFETLNNEEKKLVSALDLEMGEQSISDDVPKLIAQWYKKKWKMMLNEAKERLNASHGASISATMQPLLIEMQELKQKLLQRGLL